MRLEQRRFTLIEMLTAMAIILVLAGSLMVASSTVMKKVKINKTKAQIKALQIALEQYHTEWGYYPQSPGGGILEALIEGKTVSGNYYSGIENQDSSKKYMDIKEFGLYYTDGTLRDAFSNPLQYQCPGTRNPEQYDLWSFGYEGPSAGEESLIANWKRLN